ncbi:hypothetical protein GOP47_0014224 [Adiantum capillus-veneris]|uniref:Secreted protein n=1 Tax=Adiantum capillus-veneris TaxID=13818 RepID=A0A9D4URD2_ADICA|nr:hypothetical protein GOP47_0014224 [Adiantum capillus-veneris]
MWRYFLCRSASYVWMLTVEVASCDPGILSHILRNSTGQQYSSSGVCISMGPWWRHCVHDHGTLVHGRAMWITLHRSMRYAAQHRQSITLCVNTLYQPMYGPKNLMIIPFSFVLHSSNLIFSVFRQGFGQCKGSRHCPNQQDMRPEARPSLLTYACVTHLYPREP